MQNPQDDPQAFLFHPIRIRILQMLACEGPLTVAALGEKMRDIPRSTIYRHVDLLRRHGFLAVAGEQKKRGACERAYTLRPDALGTPEGQAESAVTSLLLRLIADFTRYFHAANADPVRDQLFFSVNTLLLTDGEFTELQAALFETVGRYLNRPASSGRRVRNLSILSSPGAPPDEGETCPIEEAKNE